MKSLTFYLPLLTLAILSNAVLVPPNEPEQDDAQLQPTSREESEQEKQLHGERLRATIFQRWASLVEVDDHEAPGAATLSVTCTEPDAATCKIKVGKLDGEATVQAAFVPVPKHAGDHNDTVPTSSGFATLDLRSGAPEKHSDLRVPAFAAGYAEALLTAHLIPAFHANDVSFGRDGPSPDVKAYVLKSDNWIRKNAKEQAARSDFWHAASLVLARFDGIVAGYQRMAKAKDLKKLDHLDFLWLNLNGDLFDLVPAFPPKSPGDGAPASLVEEFDNRAAVRRGRSHLRRLRQQGKEEPERGSHCSAIVKLLANNEDLLFSHDTWDTYSTAAPRIYKQVTLPFRRAGETVPRTMAYSSSPGFVASIDDWYMLQDKGDVKEKAGLAVMETSATILNADSYKALKPESAFAWIRMMVANGLAASAPEWAQLFATEKSGTYNAQWMVLDVNKFEPGTKTLQDDTFWIVEEVPGLVHSADETAQLREKGYFASYNDLLYEDTRKIAGFHDHDKRAVTFTELQASIRNMTTLADVMGWSGLTARPVPGGHVFLEAQTDQGFGGIMKRGDLLKERDGQSATRNGGIDSKMSSAWLFKKGLVAYARAGPTSDGVPVFCWPEDAKQVHEGHPKCFNYKWSRFEPRDFSDS
eukprot:TRINITY_DN35466_c0_g1_i1.p1 TRINITY_DN35466_c0_g1~~TRINITY_DN35466_c0_g1_i1.p1  ORF type:complete len:641 (+),score=187.71 TRINITY_DN35466_c0_g1_i1:101-2023(+)